jgi:hypothetical protein
MNSVGLVLIGAKKVIREEHIELLRLHSVDFFSIVLEAQDGFVSNPSAHSIEFDSLY